MYIIHIRIVERDSNNNYSNNLLSRCSVTTHSAVYTVRRMQAYLQLLRQLYTFLWRILSDKISDDNHQEKHQSRGKNRYNYVYLYKCKTGVIRKLLAPFQSHREHLSIYMCFAVYTPPVAFTITRIIICECFIFSPM